MPNPYTKPETYKPPPRNHVLCTREPLEIVARVAKQTMRHKVHTSDWLHEAIIEKLEREES
jgi:hypothetical protein